jgi:hypothetical protein
MAILQLVHATNFLVQVTFVTKILIVALTLVTNNNEFRMKEKVNKIRFHPLASHICIVICN